MAETACLPVNIDKNLHSIVLSPQCVGVTMSRAGFELLRRGKNLRRVFSHLIRDRRGNVAAIAALLMIPVLGGFALATEASGWYLINRAAQNAADSAALAAASNNDFTTNGTTYKEEGMAVAATYGFTDGTNAATVMVTHITTDSVPACTASKGGCYEAVVTKSISLYFSQIIGYKGNTAFGAGRGQLIQAGALAVPKSALVNDCITSLGPPGRPDAILFNGSPMGNLTGCVLKANGDVTCNSQGGQDAHPDNFRIIVYGGSEKKCEPVQQANGSFPDPYAGHYSVPANPCGGNYPGQTISSLVGSTVTVCGNATLGGNIQASGNQVLVIENGALNLNGNTLSTPAGTGLTIVFSGTSSVANFITGNGTLDIAAPGPPSGCNGCSWSGVAIYQDPSLPETSLTLNGNNQVLKITGLFYIPKTDLTLGGAIDQATNGLHCFTIVDNTVNINGNGSIFAYPAENCLAAGLQPPQSQLFVGAQLIY